MSADKKSAVRRERELLFLFDGQVKDIRQQLNDQLKCLDVRLETQVALVAEIQDYFRRRADVELEYSRSLDKLSKSLLLRHKSEKLKREQWHLFSSYSCWQQLVSNTKKQSRDHAALSEIYAGTLIGRLTHLMEDVQRIYRTCRGVGVQQHEELLKVLHELHTTMKTYHSYRSLEQQAEAKLNYVASQKVRLEQTIPKEKLEKSKKFRVIEKEVSKREAKHREVRLKSLKARNEYLLCMESANAAVQKYFVDDLSDLVDCMDFGFHTCLSRALFMYSNSEECLQRSLQRSAESLGKCTSNLDSRTDKQRFLEYNNAAFMVPKKFAFQPYKGDETSQVNVEHPIQDELEQRFKQLNKRLTSLKTENEEIWKTLETAEKSLLDMMSAKDTDCSPFFEEGTHASRNGVKQPETIALKLRADKQETEDFYLEKFRDYTLGCNVVARLQAKSDLMSTALGKSPPTNGDESPSPIPQSRPPRPRKKRIGRQATRGQPKLFEGSLEEYVEATNQEVPLIIRSCIRVINLYGLHHQGVFRVSGSQVEINNFKDAFERGEDPLADVSDASDINSVAGVLKLYLRELREPLFPIFYFDQLMEISQLESKKEFISKVRDVVRSFPRPVFVVLRYLFAFLNHLSEFSDENMMDPYNLAICFGPTLVPIPEDKDQVQYQNLVNELVKGIIVYQEEIFPDDGGIVYEKYISADAPDDNDVGESPPDQTVDQIGDVEVDSAPAEEDALTVEPEISINLFGKSERLEATAQYDFAARSERELSFKRGDTLVLYTQVSPDWWKGHFEGKDGLIPDKYIMLKIKDEDRDKASIDGSNDKQRRTSSSSDSLSGVSPKTPRSTLRSTSILTTSSQDEMEPLSLDSPKVGGRGLPDAARPGGRRRSLSPCSLGGPPPPDPRRLRPSTSMSDSLEPTLELATPQELDRANLELARDLDDALARVHSSIDCIERSKKSDTPDLVLDLPVSPSSPTANDGATMMDDALMTTAERFAMSNQCTLKKGATSRARRNSCGSEGALPTSDNGTVPTSGSATSVRELSRKFAADQGAVTPSKPPLKAKPPVLVRKSTGSPEAVRCEKEYKQTSF
ncbi:SLIT-ROBO Rho GTPase-activating protein 1-like isoform X2 [Ornithodoros turicata]|uniref:SLIT-ROBO Rho GTPase-activating protein 1-like isoform X2 n=1 Tax=Ornithodoros turicata TaxID=34597 RepID=UPI0031393240